ncbi:MAG: hypothetical protein MJZ37_06840 [Bacilli bacterium]|nr:hypothetical protein [Bacilli bacterium]
MEKEDYSKLETIKQIRFPRRVGELIECRAKEKKTNFSEIVRIACMNYLDKDIQDSQLIYASLNDAKRKIGYLETKQDLMAILIIELARKIIKDLPSRVNASDEITELEFDKFMDSCSTEAKLTKNGFLDSLAMEIYERSAKGGD